MICNGCGNPTAVRVRITSDGESCNASDCGRLGMDVGVPDVYFKKPYLDPHLVDVRKPEQRHGVWIESRRQKAEIMNRLNVRELGDKRGGARIEDKFTIRREKEKGHGTDQGR